MKVRFDLTQIELERAIAAGFQTYGNRAGAGGRVYLNSTSEALDFINRMEGVNDV